MALTEHHAPVEHGQEHVAVHAHDDSPEAVKREVRKYFVVFFALACLTAVTVGISYLHLESREAIAVALIIASIKAFLVAGYFMHLLSERKLIYAVLAITVFFFAMLLWAPWNHHYDYFGR
jgi:cytochrome c oxidase subunit IV